MRSPSKFVEAASEPLHKHRKVVGCTQWNPVILIWPIHPSGHPEHYIYKHLCSLSGNKSSQDQIIPDAFDITWKQNHWWKLVPTTSSQATSSSTLVFAFHYRKIKCGADHLDCCLTAVIDRHSMLSSLCLYQDFRRERSGVVLKSSVRAAPMLLSAMPSLLDCR